MSTIKIIELIGISEKSWEDAAANAIQEAQKTVEHITGLEVVSQTAKVENNTITSYRTTVKVAFVIEH